MKGPQRRWPLLVIGASAGTATWSGWVGLGALTGFGLVHPLPGIADGLTVNTAVTLPVGVEAYASYALSVATTARPLAPRTRRYAWASAAGALTLGMAGQVAYHLLTAAGVTTAGAAPWPVVAVVSCLPVLVLGAAALLWHLAGTDASDPSEHDDVLDEVPVAAAASAAVRAPAEVDDVAVAVAEAASALPVSRPSLPGSGCVAATPGVVGSPCPSGSSVLQRDKTGPVEASWARVAGWVGSVRAREDDVRRLRAAVASGVLPPRPSTEQVRAHLAIGRDFARAARDAVRDEPAAVATDSDDQRARTTSAEHPQETPATAEEPRRTSIRDPDQQSDPENYQPPQQYQHHDHHPAIPQQLPENQITHSENTHTYATPLP